MPRQRTPLAQAEATGDIAKNKKRFAGRLKAPKYGGTLGPAPMHFNPEQILIWDELVGKIPPEILAAADCYIVEIASLLIWKMRFFALDMKPVELGHLRAALGSLGMTPADRTRVTKADGEEEQSDSLSVLIN